MNKCRENGSVSKKVLAAKPDDPRLITHNGKRKTPTSCPLTYIFLKSIKSFSQLYGNYQQLEPFFQMFIRINTTIFSKIPPVFVQVANYNTKNKDKRQGIYI